MPVCPDFADRIKKTGTERPGSGVGRPESGRLRSRRGSRRERVSDCITDLERYKQENSHFEFFWLPYTSWAQAKFINETESAPTGSTLWGKFNKVVLENGVYWLLSECCRLVPSLSKPISKFSAQAIGSVEEVDYSHRLFATMRVVRFQEMEYNLPAAALLASPV